jgi:polar amino acid transport system substrate-binding protein
MALSISGPVARSIRAVAVLAAIAAPLAGCGSDDSGAAASSNASGKAKHASNKQLAAQVPADVRKAGKIVVATDASYPPFELYGQDNKTVVGMDPDLGKAIGGLLGVNFEFRAAGFDSIIPGLSSHRFGLGMSSMTVTKEREKVVDFVTYSTAGTLMLAKAGEHKDLSASGDALCGMAVAVLKGSSQQDPDLSSRQKSCSAHGKPPIKAMLFPNQNEVNLAISSGHADIALADSPTVQYVADRSKGKLEPRGDVYASAPYGIAVPKDAGNLKVALQGSVNALIKNGTYAKILKKWGLEAGSITSSEINPVK